MKMTRKHKGEKYGHWKPLAAQVGPVLRLVLAPMRAESVPDRALSDLVAQVGAEASAGLLVAVAIVAGVVRDRNVPTQVAAAVREGWAGARRPRGGRHQKLAAGEACTPVRSPYPVGRPMSCRYARER